MTDERLMAAFGRLDATVAPDPVFSERLFAALVQDVEWGTMPDHSLGGRLRRALGIGPMPTGMRAVRLAWLVAILGLLLALAWATIFIASHLRTTPTPAELVRLSQQTYEHPPAFSVMYKTPSSGDVTLSADGAGTWRIEEPVYGNGSYWLWDGATRVGSYDPQTLVWTTGTPKDVGIVGPPAPFWSEYTWGTGDISSDDPVRHVMPCAGAESLGEADVLGHVTDHIRCADIDLHLWLDRETHLILRIKGGPNSYHWGLSVVEATSFTVGPQSPTAFDWTGPADAYAAGEQPVTQTLVVGRPAPPWEATTPDGAAFRTADVKGPVVYLLTATWCACEPAAWDAVTAEVARRPSIRGVIVAADAAGTLTGYASAHPTSMTIVADPRSIAQSAWGISEFPVLVVLDTGGRVASISRARIATDDLAKVLDAALAGGPVPSVATLPTIPTPAPSYEVVGTPQPRILTWAGSKGDRLSSMPFGATMPVWSGPLMTGGRLRSESLRGRPTVLWFMRDAACGSSCTHDDLASLAADAKTVGDRVAVIVIANGELTPGWLAQWFAKRGLAAQVVFDWDNRILMGFHTLGGTFVFDAEGRLVDERDWAPNLAELQLIADRLGSAPAASAPGASPSPAPSPTR